MLWIDKYRPKSIEKLSFNSSLSQRLKIMAESKDIPHILFYGPPGAGKRTRVLCLLKELFGPGVLKMKLDYKTITTPSSSKVEITTISSNYHIEINPSDAGNNDCFVVQEVIKEMASVRTLNSTNSIPFKVIILTGIEQLTSTAQAALRRTMEKYTGSCRLIFITETLSQVIEPVQSRCLPIRVGSPTPAEIKTVLEEIIKKEAVYIDDSTVDEIVKNSNRNLRRAIISLEVNGLHNKGSFIPDWELYIRKIASSILREQTPKQLLEIRKSLYDLLVNCIPPHIIINVLVSELSKSLDDIVKGELYKTASLYENRLRQGGKEIIHLEAFISQFMCDYKRFISSLDVEF